MAQEKVLVVDDERGVRESIRMLIKDRFQVVLASGGREAIACLAEERPDVVLLDLRMPDMGGIEVLQNIKAQDPHIEVILVTAYATVDTARKALRLGAFDYLTKPFNPYELEGIVRRAFERRQDVLRRSATLEAIQQNYQTLRKEVEMAKRQMAVHVRDTVYALLMSLELRDSYSGKHSMAVLWLVDQFSLYLGLDDEDRARVKRAALVHDLGKIGVPEDILNKPEPLSVADRDIMQGHAILSGEIVGNVKALTDLAPIVRAHHEWWNGKGYPDGLAGDSIPWEAQVLAICDTLHAMSSDRCYRPRLAEQDIRTELRAQSGTQFREDYVEAMLASGLIAEIFHAEGEGKLVLTSQQVRHVLDDTGALDVNDADETPAPRLR
jgi:response regulator RpfG family c-di-GMP phosphodiesterase